MLKNLRLKSNAMLVAFVLSFLIFASNGAYAQYCEFTGGTWGPYAPLLTEVQVDEVSSTNVFQKGIQYKGVTGYDQYKNWGENYRSGAEGIQLGKRYQVTVRGLTNSSGYSGYVRVFMDLNANGKWSDAGEYLGAISVGVGPLNTSNFTYGVVGWSYGGWYFNVPCNAPLSKTRLRVISGYNYLGGTPLSEPCVISYYDSPSYTFGKYFYGEVEDHELTILPDAPKSIPTDVAVFNASNVKVEDFTLLLANTNYSQVWAGNATATPTPKPSLQFGSNTAGTIVQMRIEGPLPSTTVVWEARNGLNTSNTITMGSNGDDFSAQYTDSDGKAKYTFAPTKSSGAYSPNGDGAFYGTSGGEYKLVITVAGTGCPGAANRLFTVAYPNDVAVATITSPLNNDFPKYAKYGVGQTVKLEAIFQNVGLNPVTEFWAYYTIRDANNNVVYNDSTYWDTTGSNGTIPALKSGEKVPLLLGYRKFNAPALYTMEVTVSRATGLDDEKFNSSFPRPGSPVYVFEVAYDIELSASQIFAPASGDLLIAGRQYRASAEFKNNGISLASKVPVSMVIINDSTNKVDITLDAEISDIQYGRYNTKTVNFGTFAISKPGRYRAKISVRASEDIVYGNDTMSIYFTVESGIMGTYTVGTLKETAAGFTADRNFSTLQELSNALFYNGISGSVVFELTDAVYNASTTVTNSAAWDLSSRILGLGYDAENKVYNTITFKPSLNREGIRGGVQINLSSTSGVGVRLGQSNNATSNNDFALFRTFGTQANANNAGYISFLGGAQKSIKFVNINTSATPTHNSAIYMNAGARNITVKNCIIENGTPATFKLTRLPGAEYSATGERIRFEEDYPNQSPTPTGVNSATYSAGIVLRAVTGVSSTITTVAQDTIASNGNIIEGNEISNFGVGILSLGYGPLKLAGPNTFKEFYNFNNTFANNQIYNVARAGIFLGFERNTSVKNNRIWNVGNSPMFASDAAGIQLGGNNLPVIAGYNNYEISIDGNQISDVTSTTNAIGILNEQTRRTYGLGLKTVNFPATENTKIANNIVWNLGTNNNTAASRIGIASMTSVINNNIMTPLNPGYHTNGEMIANNTIIIGDATTTTGNLVGIASIKNDNSSIYNNAISIIAPGFTATNNTVGAAIYYNGLSLRNNAGLKSDRNIFFTGNTDSKSSNVDVFRITEVNAADVITVAGANAEYRTLEQVQAWFGTNENSLYGNFASDLALNNANPPMYTVNPNLSKGSLLNNRGVNLSWVANDNSGVKRGNGGERYDIGAFEFTSPLYNEDVEVTNANGPRAYQSLSAPFNDAQYIMTTAPTTVNAIVRNNGRLPQSAYKMTVNIYRETPAGTFETTPKATATTTIALGSSESMNVNFPGFTFTPETYAQLSANVPPYNTGMFTAMSANVTPRYMIIFSGSSDELNTNNNDTIIVRYYIKKSTLSVIASGVQQSTNEFNVSTPANDMMARLNAKALEEGFSKMGWRISATENHYDRFERNAWEPRAVNYTNYLTLFWADGNNETPTANQVRDINAFLDNSKEMPKYKRNLVLASQEIVANTKATDNTFRTEVLRADLDPMYGATAGNNTPFFGRTSTPLPGTQYFGRNITGVNVARDFSMVVNMPLNINNNSVTFTNDLASFPAVLVGLNNSTLQGLTKDAFVYTDASVTGKPVMGVATTSIDRNVITLGMDWRHFGDMDLMMKGIVDYIAKNTDVVPVELVDFKATKVGQKVVLDWATASENNTSKFEVEKAVVSQTGSQDFNKVAELAAAGNSKDVKFYGPVTDYDVVPNTTYAYKLRMVDRTGEFSYSDTRLVVMNAENGIITLGDAQPNPASNSTKVAFTLSQPNAVTVTMYDVNGNAVESVSNFYTTGTHFFTPDLSKIASGSYTVVLKSGEVVLTKSLNVVK